MSYINEALKKVQQERDTHHLKYGGFLAEKENNIIFSSSKIRYALFLILPVLCAVFLYIQWNNKDVQPADVINELPEPARALIKNELAAVENISNTGLLYKTAGEFFSKGQFDEAKEFYLKALASDPGHVDALNNIGFIYLHDRDYPAARKFFEKAIRLKPAYAAPYYNMACLHAINEENRQGLIYLKKAISLDSSLADVARDDSDLEGLKSLSEFQEIIGEKGV